MRRPCLPVSIIVVLGLASLPPRWLTAEPSRESPVLVRVNGSAVTEADLELAYLVRGVDEQHRDALRGPLLERLIDERLIAALLEQRRIKPSDVLLDAQLEQILALIRRRGENPEALLARLGLDEQKLRAQLALALTWQTYARQVLTPDQFQAYFEKHRRELDGTQVRARHIVVKVSPEASTKEWEQAAARLRALRKQIESGQLTFEDAARQHSQGPSAAMGGDVGFFAHRGTMPASFADAAFTLKPGQISEPVRTHVGLHLIEVTDERPGQLSLEDVREAVFERLAADLWDQQVARERSRARIQWLRPQGAPTTP